MRIYIAEKPSMAAEIAKGLGNPKKISNSHYETNGGIVTWGYGHVLRQAEPDEYDNRYKKWDIADLPIIPETWKLYVTESCKNQFQVIKKLIAEATEIVNAGDPDREGQLLIDEILEFVQNKKPVKRILLNALDEKSIEKALGDLRDNKDFYNLKQSALARARADWLIGMNLSRAYTMAAQKAGHKNTFPIGRVKTPTISLVVRREEEIKNFKPLTYYPIRAAFKHENGTFEAEWQPSDTQINLDSEGRLINKRTGEELIKKFREETEPALITACITTQKTEPQRLPFSLSALQIEAGKRYGYDPQTVLTAAQTLYEKKVTTYPRSDCEYVPENQLTGATAIIQNLQRMNQADLSKWAVEADSSIKSRAWNDKKITAHHAIIPTEMLCRYEELTEIERKIYFLVAQAYIAQFYPIHQYEHTKIEVILADETFTASGRVIMNDGWKSIYRKEKEDKDEDSENEDVKELPKVKKNDPARYISGNVQEKTTQPPKRFTSSTLLQAMKEIHKFVKNPELKKQLKDVSGIGTEATRASIIKEITTKGFLAEEKKYLVPTEQANVLVSILPDELTYPDNTAEWEMTFEKMVDGSIRLEDFIDRQTSFVTQLCQKAGNMEIQQAVGQICPNCKTGILRMKKGTRGAFWGCSQYPECKTTFSDKKGQPDLEPKKEQDCPQCKKGRLRLISGKNGDFWACNHQECKATFDNKRNKPEIIDCPACKKGTLRKINGKKGPFWSCRNYPACTAIFSDEKGKPIIKESRKK